MLLLWKSEEGQLLLDKSYYQVVKRKHTVIVHVVRGLISWCTPGAVGEEEEFTAGDLCQLAKDVLALVVQPARSEGEDLDPVF